MAPSKKRVAEKRLKRDQADASRVIKRIKLAEKVHVDRRPVQPRKRNWRKQSPELLRKTLIRQLILSTESSHQDRYKAVSEPLSAEESLKRVFFGDELLRKLKEFHVSTERSRLNLQAISWLFEGSLGIHHAGADTVPLYMEMKKSLRSLSELFFGMSTPSDIDRIIFTITSWFMSAVHAREFVIRRKDRSLSEKDLLDMLVKSYISWNAGSSLISGRSQEFFDNVSRTVGFALEQKSSLEQFMAYVNMSIEQVHQFR